MLNLNENNIGKFNLLTTFFIIAVFAILIIFLSVSSRLEDFQLLKKEVKEKFINDKKISIKTKVQDINKLILNKQQASNRTIKRTINERVTNAHEIAHKLYLKHRTTKTNREIIELIKEILRPLRYDNGLGYIFMADLAGNELLFPVAPNLENTNVLNLQDMKGNYVIQEEILIVDTYNEGYITDYWTKPNSKDIHMVYPKLTFVKGFKELNLYIGTGMYKDDATIKNKEYITNLVSELNKQNKHDYIVISELLNINGGDKFAKILVHPTAPIGKVIGDSKKDLNGKMYRKEYLANLKKDGETYLDYSYFHKNTQKELSKISYFILNNEWNWIIGTGFHNDILDQELSVWESNLSKVIKENIYFNLIVFIIFSIILLISIYYINKVTQEIITKYKNNVHQKQLELNEINNNLEQRVKDELEKNKKHQSHLFKSEKLASMGEMIGNIAHQWRQPLSVISTAATGMQIQKEYDLLTDEEFNKSCESINKNAQYLSNTIDDFRNFIKGSRVKKVFNLSDDIKSFLHLVDGTVKTNHIDIILDLDDSIKIDGYENELTQCLINIFNNSKDALKDHKSKYIFIQTRKIEDSVTIEFKDNAGGIPQDILPKVFEPYFTTKHQSQGTGLGLHMTYQLIVDGMNGSIEVSNIEYTHNNCSYTGAKFILKLPLQ